jgi:rod shape determining protein RodA
LTRRTNIWINTDWITIGIFVILVFLGWINIYSAEYDELNPGIVNLSERYGKQLLWILAALILAIIIFIIDARFYMYFSYFFYAGVILMLIAVLVLGKEIHGSRSWFVLGNFRLQPSEFAKFATGLALAQFLSKPNVNLRNFGNVIKALLIIAAPALLILLQPDTGSTLVYAALAIVLYREGLSPVYIIMALILTVLFILTLILSKTVIIAVLISSGFLYYLIQQKRKKEVLVGAGIFVSIGLLLALLRLFLQWDISLYFIAIVTLIISGLVYLVLAYRFKLMKQLLVYAFLVGSVIFAFSVDYVFHNVLEDHQQKRINVLLGIESDPLGSGYNVNQSKIAIGSGGFWGKGFLRGTQTKFNFVPEQSTDFIFCTVGEEWGFIGSAVIIFLFAYMLFRILVLAERQRTHFSRIYGYAVFSILAFHFLVNVGMTIGLMPVIGIPLPFISYGGSSLWAFTMLLFIFLKMDATRTEFL